MKVFVVLKEKLGYHFNSLDSPFAQAEVMGVYLKEKDADDECERLEKIQETKGYDIVNFEVVEQEVE
ncbi:MAG: hypothetical protein ACWGQW_01655 [bacterium]